MKRGKGKKRKKGKEGADLIWGRTVTYFLIQIVMQQWEEECMTHKWREMQRPLKKQMFKCAIHYILAVG